MRRNAAIVAICTLFVVLSGCKSTKKNNNASLGSYDPYAYNTASDTPQYEPLKVPQYDATPAYAAPVTEESNWSASPVGSAADSSFARYHTVAKGDTLYSLARKYYSNQSKWKDIYESNRTTLSSPNRLLVGQRLLIP